MRADISEVSSLKTKKIWITHIEAAAYMGLSTKALYNLVSNGKVRTYKLGRRNRYLLEDLNRLFFPQGGKDGN